MAVLGAEVTVLPFVSWMATTGWFVHAVPAVPPPGCVVYPSFVAVPAVMLNAFAFVGAVSDGLDVAVSVSPVPTFVIAHPVKFATPDTAATVKPPAFEHESTPPGPALLLMASVTFRVSEVTVVPPAVCTATETLKDPVPVA